MKAKELIEFLNNSVESYGDVDVVIADPITMGLGEDEREYRKIQFAYYNFLDQEIKLELE